ncbi:MAG: DnaD domain protein [Oscillospiraceae bacterium]|nr:DnaD domain protein [Oscillospiraceae bacterium]
MRYGFSCGIWGNMFGVPNVIADNFLKLSTESQLKVIIYLLRNNGKSFSIEEIAENTGLTEEEVEDALIFWNQTGILPDTYEELPAVNSIFSIPEPDLKSEPETKENTDIYISAGNNYSSAGLNIKHTEIADMLESSKTLRDLFAMTEKSIGNINFTIERSLIWMNQYLGLNAEIIIMIINYCVSVNSSNISYIEKIAYTWKNNGIDTLELANNEIKRLKESSEDRIFILRIKRMFGLSRDPVPNQMKYIKKWKDENYPEELIQLAYYEAVESTGNPTKLPIGYIDKILLRWKDAGINTVAEAEKANIDFKNEFKKKKKSNSDNLVSVEENDEYAVFFNHFD